MGVYYEWTDPDFCEKSYRRSPNSSKFAQLLSAVPFWAAFAGGLVIGKMLGRSSGSSSTAKGSDRDVPVLTLFSMPLQFHCHAIPVVSYYVGTERVTVDYIINVGPK